jgi:SNF2 family DNA or RNA helicase
MKTPREYQFLASQWMAKHNAYLCDDCGLGKTLTSIEAVKMAGLAGRKGLVICRKSARTQWQDTINEQVPGAEVIITNHLRWKFNEINAWFITTYDELVPKRILYDVAKVVWDFIIMDEAHWIKNHSVARSKNIRQLDAGMKMALSATPIEKHGGELWPVLYWLDREGVGTSYWNWVNKMFEVKPAHFGGYEIGDPVDLVAYQAAVMPYVIRRTKDEVAPELPEKILIDVPLQMEGTQLEIYGQIKEARDVLVTIQDHNMLIENALALFTRLHQVATLPSLIGLEGPSVKMEWLAEWLEDHRDLRVLVFSRYRGTVGYVHENFYKYGVLRVMQGVDESEQFKRGYGQILAGTIDAMSESLSLEMADAAIFLDQHWSSRAMKQAVDRIHRMNITSKKLVYYLQACAEDRKVMKVVNGKYDYQEMLLDFVHDRENNS